jgi:hypothetical protein
MNRIREVSGILQELDKVEAILLVLSWVVVMAAAAATHSIDSGIDLIVWGLAGFLVSSLLVGGFVKLACAILDRI